MSHKQRYNDEDDDILLADIKSMKITSSSPIEETIWNDWAFQQNELYQQQLQASYYQLQYLQQQQMISMMRQSTGGSSSSNSSRRSSTSTSSRYSTVLSSNTSVKQSKSARPHRISTSNNPPVEPMKRRQSLGKRIKKVFGMTEQVSPLIEKNAVELPKPLIPIERKGMIPDSPTCSISSKRTYYRRCVDSLPSPASSTVSTSSTQHTTSTSSSSKKSLSFNPVIQLHETFSAMEYDRRCDTNTTCQKLTPVLALQIKEELNQFKLNDMSVHNDSRQYTHFFM